MTSYKLFAETMLQVNNAFTRMDMVVISSGREHCGMVEKVCKKSAKASLVNDARYALIGYKHVLVGLILIIFSSCFSHLSNFCFHFLH